VSASDVEFRVLGPLEVWVGGAAVAIGGPKLRALLALLLLDANRVVSRGRLVAEFADGEAARSDGGGALRVQISRLRTVLGDAGVGSERVVSRPPGYLLRVEAGELDLHTFERLCDEAWRARDNGDMQATAALLREAESLWRGRALADLEFEPFARIEAERLEESRLTALEERIEAELALGRHARLVAELEALVAVYPLRERLRGQQMLALYRAGRQPEALEAYREARALLVEELALEPGPQLRNLEQAILRQERSLDVELPGGERTQTTVSTVASDHVHGELPLPSVRAGARRRRPGWRLALLAVPVLGIAAAIAGSMLAGGTTQVSALADANQLALFASDGAVKAAVGLPGAPTGMAFGFGSLWISEEGSAQVVRVDPKRRAIVATIPVGRGPAAIIAGAGDVWVVNTLDATVSRIDPGADKVAQTIRVGTEPSDLAVAGGSVWVANHGDGTLTRIDPRTGRVSAVVHEGTAPRALAAARSTLWVADDGAGTVSRLDAATGRPVDVIHVGDTPSALVAAASGVWVLDRLDATLSRIDPQRDVVESTVPLSGAPGALVVSKGAVWVSDASGGRLTRVDPSYGTAATAVQLASLPEALALDRGLWVATATGGASHRGGTLRVVWDGGVIDTIDPAASTSADVSPTEYLGLTNDGLVTFDHTDGPDGARLVPDLALSLPRPVDGGRSYTFRLRRSVRYSTGATVKAGDVRHSFERLFKLRSSGRSFYLSIIGAARCIHAPSRCDLSHGIVTNEQADTVTFHLRRPDPDFLAKLTLPYAFVLPATTPARAARLPLAATGPYEIASYRPAREVLLVRNPHFHEWSNAAQPDGYPARIVMRLVPTFAGAGRLMTAGNADFMTNVGGPPANARGYFLLHHPSQMRINPGTGTNFLFLDVHAPPFNRLRVRRALNFALDRNRIVAGFGGPAAATPACQLLPPGIPGYKRYCPYTRHPAKDGRWRSPDLARARRLVANSGTAGMKVVVWDLTGGPPIEGVPPVDALRRLGYHASLRLLPQQTYFRYTDDSRNHAQVIEGGWSADYPTANDFIGKLACAYSVPGSQAVDSSQFCDPAFDHQVAHAAALQTTDPPAADRLWARLDREVTDRAILLPTVTLNATDLLSSRVGNYHYNPVWGALVDQLWVR
jgi:ABC-type transport system substrate-binding protein/DNA-binding SARP family transcriptional activator